MGLYVENSEIEKACLRKNKKIPQTGFLSYILS